MPSPASLIQRWASSLRAACLPIFFFVALAFLLGHLTASAEPPLTPPFTFTNGINTIEASGAWRSTGAATPNSTKIFCWFPVNSCQVTVAEFIPDGLHNRLQLTDTELDITQLSDEALIATASTTDPCYLEMLRIDRTARSVTLTTGPSGAAQCAGTPTKTATLGE
jgi:hypothetical protein